MFQKSVLFIASVASVAFAAPAAAQSASVDVIDVDYSITPKERPVGSDERPIAPPCCGTPGPSLTMSVAVESKALFTDQAFTATDRPTAVTDINVSVGGWMFDLWHRQPLTDHACDRETDYGVFKTLNVGAGVEAEAKVAYIAVCGRDAVTTRLRFKHGLGKGFALQVGGERIRGGFVDNVLRSQLTYHREYGKRWTLDASATAAHSTYGKGMTFAGSASLDRSFKSGWAIQGYATAYTGRLGNDFGVGLGLHRSFSLGR